MNEYLPLLVGSAFALTGLLLLLLQVLVTDLSLAHQALCDSVGEGFEHDTKIFPDHVTQP